MAKTTIAISADVSDVLKRSTYRDNNLVLPEQLDRTLYEAVNKVLTLCGGKWNRSAKAHVFAEDPRPKLGVALEAGSVVNEKVLHQAFYTPKALAEYVVAKADVMGAIVLEPSAGEGALADACKEAGAFKVDCVEINKDVAYKLSERHVTLQGDFLRTSPQFLCSYPRIVMNPPFTRNQDILHVEHALRFLAPGGRLVAIMGGNVGRDGFKRLVEATGAEVEELPEGSFKESGTSVRTVLVTIEKGKA